MRYERFQPRTDLADYVEHFWLVEADLGPEWREEILVPNGRPTLLVSLGTPGRRRDPETGAVVPNVTGFSGISTGPVLIGQHDQVRLVAAQLRPFAPSALEAETAIDRHIPLHDWVGANAARALEGSIGQFGTSEAAIRHLEAWLAGRLVPLPAPTLPSLGRAVAALDGPPPDDVNVWAERTGLSYSQLYRLFRQHVGLTPKKALMIARYQALVGGLIGGLRGDGLAQLALLQGYYDQAHANRDFRRFTGVTPTRFTATLNGIARMMHAPAQDLSNSR